MASFSTVLTSVLMTAAGRLISAFGVSMVTYTGFNMMQSKFVSWISSQFNSIPADGLQLVYMAGVGVFMNWIFGALAFIVSIKSVAKLSTVVAQK